jgi:hypothetical protein
MTTNPENFSAGPGPAPEPWNLVSAGTIAYDGAVLIPSGTIGGSKGAGTLNVGALFIQGINFLTTISGYLPLSGGTLTGPLNVGALANLAIPGGTSGFVLSTNGSGSLSWIAVGGLADAPSNANFYGRLGGAWVIATYLPLAGGTLTGSLTLAANPTTGLGAATKTYVDNGNALNVPLVGGTLTGPLVLAADPTIALGASTKQYVDNLRSGENRLINGDMRIDQRNNGASGTAGGPAVGAYTADRWQYFGSQITKITWQRIVSPISGFAYSLRATSNSAYTVLSGDSFYFFQPIEAEMITDFQWGTANAQPVSLSFWVISSLTGTFAGAIIGALLRSYIFTYSIPVANTWTKITISNIPGDTSGSWLLTGPNAGVNIFFDLGSGTTFKGTAATWSSSNVISVTGAVSIVGTSAATIQFTGIKFEIGSVATSYNRQSLAKAQSDCQRYYQLVSANARFPASAGNQFDECSLNWQTMRANPTSALISAGTSINLAATYPLLNNITTQGSRFTIQSAAAGDCFALGYLYALSAEL